ncbi:hypothetical protein NPIL_58311 [Nephila pilipes]|uniref:Uncharacterized protein n=1 Tax=Nephila pilipes TaxID=299642 RepID=A0A8X6NKG7_NEPPI|nr:hypothetical protein NPIL_58311 [Nephila pilipes]
MDLYYSRWHDYPHNILLELVSCEKIVLIKKKTFEHLKEFVGAYTEFVRSLPVLHLSKARNVREGTFLRDDFHLLLRHSYCAGRRVPPIDFLGSFDLQVSLRTQGERKDSGPGEIQSNHLVDFISVAHRWIWEDKKRA